MIKTISAALAVTLLTSSSFAQFVELPCGSDDLSRLVRFHNNDPAELERMAQNDAELEAFTAAWAASQTGAERVDYVIPVVFHIIHNNGPENISDEQVYDAVRILNDDFNKLNPDWTNVRSEFLGIVGDIGVEFRLARLDPQGNCTKGITRTVSPLTNDGTQTMKDLIQWPRNKYLNIWVAASADGAAGYTYRPGSVSNWPEADGIVLLHTYTGSIGTGSASRSRALTHEVGHWINLKHTWGDGNEPGLDSNCNQDDGVSDTPNTRGWTSCFLSGASCGGTLDNVENYMEYAYCSKMFTEGQKTRMLAALNSGTAQRNQLTSANNLIATGVNGAPVLCAAEFVSSSTLVCAGSTVQFSDVSFHGITSRTWNFQGGEPATSTDADPSVVYNVPGTYSVELTVSDGVNTLTTQQTIAVTVLANPGATSPILEGFETITGLNGPEWYTMNPNADNTFGISTVTAFTGSRSLRVLNTAAMVGNTDELLSQTYDMSNAEDITISFRYAFAKRTATSDDVLSLLVSSDCGELWALRKIMRGSTTLTTGGVVTGNFVPTASQWNYVAVTNINATSHVSNFRFKFVFESDGGNNLYLDDINISSFSVGENEVVATASTGPMIFPNPASQSIEARFVLPATGSVRTEVLDPLGRVVLQREVGLRQGGVQHRVNLDTRSLPSGTYILRVLGDTEVQAARFIIE